VKLKQNKKSIKIISKRKFTKAVFRSLGLAAGVPAVNLYKDYISSFNYCKVGI